MKKLCAIFGNCQATAMTAILADHSLFTTYFDILPLRPVYEMTAADSAELANRMADVALFIAQDVAASYLEPGTRTLAAMMPSDGLALLFQVAWFDAYNPDMHYLKRTDGAGYLSGPFADYHSRVVVEGFKSGKSVAETVASFEGDRDPQSIVGNFTGNLERLRTRESHIDIGIADEIERVFRDKKLFHTLNHPSADIQFHMVDRVLSALDLPLLGDDTKAKHAGTLGSVRWPINRSVAHALELTFDIPDAFVFDGNAVSAADFVEANFSFYDENVRLLM